jgi:predicted nucleic acid-binding protein
LNRLIIDTNLLVLLVVGSAAESHIASHKRTRVYDGDAFRLLAGLVRQAASVVVTPHVLAETSNLIRQCREPLANALGLRFAAFVVQAEEEQREAREIVHRPEHIRLGLTDAGLLDVQKAGAVLLTDDIALYLASLAAGFPAINFSHLREMA